MNNNFSFGVSTDIYDCNLIIEIIKNNSFDIDCNFLDNNKILQLIFNNNKDIKYFALNLLKNKNLIDIYKYMSEEYNINNKMVKK